MIAGQKAKFTEVGVTQQFTLIAELTAGVTVIDVACFGLDAQ